MFKNSRSKTHIIGGCLFSSYAVTVGDNNIQHLLDRFWELVRRREEPQVLKDFLRANHELRDYRDAVGGKTLLHFVCFHPECNATTVDCILQVDPDAAQKTNNDGCFPLSIACLYKRPISMIRILVNAYPEAVEIKWGELQSLPLHDAFRSLIEHGVGETCMETVRFLYELYPEALRTTHVNGFLPIHSAVCSPYSRPALVEWMHEQDNNILAMTTSRRDTPLHLACSYPGSTPNFVACIACLVRLYPQALEKENLGGYLPLHVLHKRFIRDVMVEEHLTQIMVKAYPQALLHRNHEGKLPMDLAANPHAVLQVNRQGQFVSMNPSAIKPVQSVVELLTPRGRWSLDFACEQGTSSTISHLIQDLPQLATAPPTYAHSPMLPFFSACANYRLGVGSIQTLSSFFSSSDSNNVMDTSDPGGNSSLHYCCKRKQDPEVALDVAKFLLDHNSASLLQRNNNGATPLKVACTEDAPLDMIYLLLRKAPGGLGQGTLAVSGKKRSRKKRKFVNGMP